MSFTAKRKKKKKSSNRIKDKQVPHTVLQKLSPKTLTSPLMEMNVSLGRTLKYHQEFFFFFQYEIVQYFGFTH